MPKTKKAAKTSKSPKAKPVPRAKASKKVTSAPKSAAKPKTENNDTKLYKDFTASLDALVTYWQKRAQKSKANSAEQTEAQTNASKYNLLKQMVADFEHNWQQKPAATNSFEKNKRDEPSVREKKHLPLSKRSAPAEWEDDMESLSEFGEDEIAENLDDDIFLPLDEDELSFEGDDYTSDMMDDDN